MEDIKEILQEEPHINYETYKNPTVFHEYCKPYRSDIEESKKELFILLLQHEQDIKKEITRRQMQMLQEIGVIAPSIRVKIVIERTK
jgi:hypothetical protein